MALWCLDWENKKVGSEIFRLFIESLVRLPVRRDLKFFECVRRIVRLDGNFEEVLAAHTFVHHEIHIDHCLLTGL
jgi:hypothetical protein